MRRVAALSLLLACAAGDKPPVMTERACPVSDAAAEPSMDWLFAQPDASVADASVVDAGDPALAVDAATVKAAHALALKPVTLPATVAHEKPMIKALSVSENNMPPEVVRRIARLNLG